MELHKVMDDDVTLTAGAADHDSDVWEQEKYVSVYCLIKITNGATGPTVAAQAQIQVSYDGTNYYNYGGALTGNTDNNGVESWVVHVPPCFRYVKVVSGSNTDEDVTIRVEGVASF